MVYPLGESHVLFLENQKAQSICARKFDGVKAKRYIMPLFVEDQMLINIFNDAIEFLT